MTTFLGINKPSQAVRAMVAGLRNPGNILIDMGTYGDTEEGMCFGCAATVTLQALSGVAFDSENIMRDRCEMYGESPDVIQHFESGIDQLRMGRPHLLMRFFDPDVSPRLSQPILPPINDDYSQDVLMEYVAFAWQLEKEGL